MSRAQSAGTDLGSNRTPDSSGLSRRRLTIVFAGMGGTAAAIPALVPALAERLAVSIDTVLPAVPALFTGLVVGIVAAGGLARRVDTGWALNAAAALQAAGLVAVGAAATPQTLIIGAAASGIGFGVAEVLGASAARRLTASHPSGLLNRLMAVLAGCAVLTPFAVFLATESGFASAAALLVALVHVCSLRLRRRPTPGDVAATVPRSSPGTQVPSLTVALLAGATFFYVGAETVLSGWSAAAIAELMPVSVGTAALGTSGFWLLMTIGRAITGHLLRTPNRTLPILGVATGLLFAALLGASLLGTAGGSGTLLVLAIAVLAAAPCYGIVLGIAVDLSDDRAAALTASVLIAVGALGGATIPAIVTLADSELVFPLAAASAGCFAALVFVGALRAHLAERKDLSP